MTGKNSCKLEKESIYNGFPATFSHWLRTCLNFGFFFFYRLTSKFFTNDKILPENRSIWSLHMRLVIGISAVQWIKILWTFAILSIHYYQVVDVPNILPALTQLYGHWYLKWKQHRLTLYVLNFQQNHKHIFTFLPSLHTDMTQVIEIFSCRRQELTHST